VAGLSALTKLMQLLRREAPAQADKAREALRVTAGSGNEAAVVGGANIGPEGRIVMGDSNSVRPSSFDRRRALRDADAVVDFHTHPSGVVPIFGPRPSDEDFLYYSSSYPDARLRGRELRAIIAAAPDLGMRERAAYSMFATERPQVVFDAQRLAEARGELQMAGARGKFSKAQMDPALRDYFDYGGDIGDVLAEIAPLTLLRHRADQGLGRLELTLGGRPLTPDRASSEERMFRLLQDPAIELMRQKKFARGGLAQVKECSCHD